MPTPAQEDRADYYRHGGTLKSKIKLITKYHVNNGWAVTHDFGREYVQYYCSRCCEELTPGPSGAGTNQVCEKCRVNYGCLPGALER